jgi:class 3 adenylate cyclase
MVADVPETHFARSADGTNLAYQISGSGPIDLVWSGAGVPFELLWDDPGFERMATRLGSFSRCIWPVHRGWGASEGSRGWGASQGDADPQVAFVAERTDEDYLAVLDGVGSERAVFVGWGLTGGSVIHLAATHPERVRALVLVDSCAHYVREDDYPWGYPRQRLEDIAALLQTDWGTSDDLDITAPSRKEDEHLRTWWGRLRRSTFSPTFYAGGFRASVELDLRSCLSSISAPTLVLHREGDRLIQLGAGRFLADHIEGARFVVLHGDEHLFFVGDSDALVDEIEEFLTGVRPGAEGDAVTATILFTDIVASTEHQTRLGQREWSRLNDRHDAMVRAALFRHRGHEVKTTGDGFLATFDATGRALRSAIDIMSGAKDIGLELRAGIHAGEVELRGNDIFGLAVNIAKRVCDLAAPNEVLVSETVRLPLVGSGVGFDDRGEHMLKGVPGTWQLYAVTG